MNEQERSELEWLKQRQARLAQELAQLSTQLNGLEQRLSRPQPDAAGQGAGGVRQESVVRSQEVPRRESPPGVQRPAPEPVAISPVRVPPVIPPVSLVARNSVPPTATAPKLTAAPAPISIPPPVPKAAPVAAVPVAASPPAVSPPRLAKPEPAVRGSFEMRLGTYWLVRIGIVMVLTALVFFGNLAYHNYISKRAPARTGR
jgi:uncharacterized membrane protein